MRHFGAKTKPTRAQEYELSKGTATERTEEHLLATEILPT